MHVGKKTTHLLLQFKLCGELARVARGIISAVLTFATTLVKQLTFLIYSEVRL